MDIEMQRAQGCAGAAVASHGLENPFFRNTLVNFAGRNDVSDPSIRVGVVDLHQERLGSGPPRSCRSIAARPFVMGMTEN